MNENLESILRWLSFFTLFIIITGNIYVSSYYSVFNINIYEYIDISEIFTLFLADLIKLAPWFFSLFILSIGLWVNREKPSSSPESKSLLKDIIQLILTLAISIASILSSIFNNSIIVNYLFSTLGTAYFCYVMSKLYIKSFEKTKQKKWIYAAITMIVVQSYFLIDSTGKAIAKNIINPKSKSTHKVFYFEKDTIKTGVDFKLIGSTSKWIFFYKKLKSNKNKTLVINKDKLLNKTEISMQVSN